MVTDLLRRRESRVLVVEPNGRVVESLREQSAPALYGDAANPAILAHAHLDGARLLVVTIPELSSVRRTVECARRINPRLDIVARTHAESELAALRELGAGEAVLGEWETALELGRRALHRFGVSAQEAQGMIQRLRVQGPPAGAGDLPA